MNSVAEKDFAVYQYVSPYQALKTDADFLIWSSAVSVVGEIVDVIYKVNDLLIPEVYSFMTDNTTSSDLIKNCRNGSLHYRWFN